MSEILNCNGVAPSASRSPTYLKIEDPIAITSPVVRAFYEYWLSRHVDGIMPQWSDIDLMEIYELAPHIAVKDVIDGGREFRNRYWGTGMASAYGFDATGKTFSDYLDHDPAVEGQAFHRSIVETAQPKKSSSTLAFWRSKTYVSFEGIVCPLRGKSGEVEKIISCYDFHLGD